MPIYPWFIVNKHRVTDNSLTNKNSQHLHCCSLVLAYSFRSSLQNTLPSIQFCPSSTLNYLWPVELLIKVNKFNQNIANELSVPTVNIARKKRFKSVFVNRINSCCPSYATKACHLASWPSRSRTVAPESKPPLKMLSCNNIWTATFTPDTVTFVDRCIA